MADQLFYGKLSRVSPKGNGSNGYIRIIADTTENNNTLYWVSNEPGFAGLDRIEVGQTVAIGGSFTSTIASLSADKKQIVLADTWPEGTGTELVRIDPPQGEYYVASASFYDPTGLLSVENLTGEFRPSGAPSDIIYGISAPAYDLDAGKALKGVFHRYYIYENLGYNIADSTVDLYLKWGEPGTEAESGHRMLDTTQQVLPIYALSNTQSLGPTFDTTVPGLEDLEGTVGSRVSNYQIDLVNFYDRISGSLSSQTGSFLITGSAVGNILTLVKNDGESFDIQISGDAANRGAYILGTTGSTGFSNHDVDLGEFNIDGTRIETSIRMTIANIDGNGTNRENYFSRLTTGSLVRFTNLNNGEYYAKEITGILSSGVSSLVDYYELGLASGFIYAPDSYTAPTPGDLFDITFEGLGVSTSGAIGYLPTPTGSFVITGSVYKGPTSSTINLVRGESGSSFDLEIFPFPYTGSARILGSLDVTGSVEIEGGFGESPFLITLPHYAKNPKPIEVNSEGVFILGSASASPPTPVAGGIMYSGSNYFLGFI